MIEFFINLFKKKQPHFPGVLFNESKIDELPKLSEIVATASPVTWKEIDVTKLPVYPMYSQDGSSTCVACTISLIATILYKQRENKSIKFAPVYVYNQRANWSAGMNIPDVFNIAGMGMIPYNFMPSDNLNENQVSLLTIEPHFKEIADGLSLDDFFISIPNGDVNLVASTLQATGKPLMVWFNFAYEEWKSIPTIKSLDPDLIHSVILLPNGFGTIKGKKYFIIQDSWGLSSTSYKGLRLISEDFFKARNVFTGYPRRFKFEIGGDKPKYDGSIISLQKCLKYEGFFPLNVDFIENYGPITTEGVKSFQRKFGIVDSGKLDLLTVNKIKEFFI